MSIRHLVLLPLWAYRAAGCTTLAVGRAATTDGSVLLSHSDDGEATNDARLCFVPAADHPPGSQRPVYWDMEDYPRFVGYGRGSCYEPKPGQKPYQQIGSIPQVPHTFAYYEATYGIINEKGLGIGETTCSGVFGTLDVGHGGKALLSIDSLTKIAMERASKAREAVQLMGSLAEAHGFYGVGSFEGTAESLMVGDAEEVFIFHILPDPTGTGAIWAAQRVPDDHVAVVANMFVIREINFEDSQNFLFSESVKRVAAEKGWWKEGQPLDFTRIYSDGEYASKFYSGRRMWGAYRLFGITLPDNYTNLRYDLVYPATAKPASQVAVPNLFAIHRDHYEGTPYDTSKGLAAGPWADPDRWNTDSKAVSGHWERVIGIYRTTQTHVVQARSSGQGSVMWYGPHNAAATCFIPLSAPTSLAPPAYTIAEPNALSHESAYWAHRFVFNVAKIKYSFAMQDVRALQAQLESEGADLVALLDAPGTAPDAMNAAYAKHADKVVKAFWDLSERIVEKYADGWVKDEAAGYPDWWLKAVGYQNGPPNPPTEPTVTLRRVAEKGAKGENGCDDATVRACVRSCADEGFARCAADCTVPCVRAAQVVV